MATLKNKMKTSRLIQFSIIFALIYLMLLVRINALQPALPTTIYGKVLNTNGEPLSGIDVSVTWIDTDDVERTTTTKTLSKEQALALGDSSLEGNYLFNQGYMLAKLNSDIVIKINGFEYERITSNPSGVIKVSNSILASKQTTNQGNTPSAQGSGSFESTPNKEGSTSIGINNGDFDSDDFDGTPTSPVYPSSTSDTKYQKTTATPVLPTTLFGQLLNEEGEPIEDEQVTAEWTDEFGITHTSTTKTLSKKEAKKLGNASLSGYYMFNKGDIAAKPNTTIKITSENVLITPKEISPSPGKSIRVEDKKVETSPQEIEKKSFGSDIKGIFKKGGALAAEGITKTINYLKYILFVMVFIISLLLFAHRKKISKRVRDMLTPPAAKELTKDITKSLKKELSQIMTKKVITTTKDTTIVEVLDTMVSKEVNNVAIMQGKSLLGIISYNDIIKKVDIKKDLSSIKVEQVMDRKFLSAQPNMSVSEATKLLLKSCKSKLVVTKNNRLLGIVTQNDLAKEYYSFFMKNDIEAGTISLVRNVMDSNAIIITKNDKLINVLSNIISKGTDYALVVKETKNRITLDNIVGIITLKDFEEELYKNPSGILFLAAKNIMKSPVIYTTPGLTVLEANNLLIEKGIKILPVIANNTLVGVINQTTILNAIYDFLNETVSRAKKDSSGIITLSKEDETN